MTFPGVLEQAMREVVMDLFHISVLEQLGLLPDTPIAQMDRAQPSEG